MRMILILLAAVLAVSGCKVRKGDDASVKSSTASTECPSCAPVAECPSCSPFNSVVAQVNADLVPAESRVDTTADLGNPGSDGSAYALIDEDLPAQLRGFAQQLDGMADADILGNPARAHQLSLDLQALAQLSGNLTDEQRARIQALAQRVSRVIIQGQTPAPPPAPPPPPRPADTDVLKHVDGRIVECAEHPDGNAANQQQWAIRVDGSFIMHQNGAHEMMTRGACVESLRHIKNGLVCAGRRSAFVIRFNGLFRLADQAAVGDATEFGMNRYELCYQAVDNSSPTQVCGFSFGDTSYALSRYDIDSGAKVRTYPATASGFSDCIAN